MIESKDIKAKIQSDFGNRASEVHKILEEAILKTEYLKSDRIIRCILFLAEKSIEKLKKNIEIAEFDPRDVMLLAEYSNRDFEMNPKRVRDFNKEFEFCEINVKE